MHDLLFNSSRLYSNGEDIQNYCFPLFTDFITGNSHCHAWSQAPTKFFTNPTDDRIPQRTAKLLMHSSYNMKAE
jgi:hypothetical protein